MALSVDYRSGPVLPIPRNDRIASWRSIVYLHGRLNPGSPDNQHLVLTSVDFERSYLTDAWERPHSSLGYATPAAFAAGLALQGAAPLRPAGSYAPQPVAPPAQPRDNNTRSLVPAG